MTSTCDCGCCQGISLLTPEDTANVPGLQAVTFRSGTHREFFESMLARLSSPAYPALQNLLVRTTDDPTIALLDAGAILDDILTFHAERIANEGYLRTATTEDSLRLIGRLVGHTPRPGVAAGTYLAYTVDRDVVVTLPAGTRAQSVPGPGETAQSFESEEDLTARFPWNDLQVRFRRPYQVTQNSSGTIDPRVIYLTGTDTSLKTGDRLLFLFGLEQGRQVLDVVQSIGVDSDNNITAVRLAGAQPLSFDAIARQIRQIADDARAGDRHTSSAIVKDYVDKVLVPLANQLPPETGTAPGALNTAGELGPVLEDARAQLEEVTQRAQPYPGVHAYLTDLQTALTSLRDQLVALTPVQDPTKPEPLFSALALNRFALNRDPAPRPDEDPALLGLEALLGSLRKPPSRPPTSARTLRLDPTKVFAAGSDAGVRLLSALDPRLAQLYQVWSKVALTTPPALADVQAMRIVAAPFGASAPQQPLFDTNGKLTGYQEWPLFRPALAAMALISIPGNPKLLILDATYTGIGPGRWVVIDRPNATNAALRRVITRVDSARVISCAAYGISGKVTALWLLDPWLDFSHDTSLGDVRGATVYAGGESRAVATQPIPDDVAGGAIELAELYDGLQVGRWIIVAGQRTDIPDTAGVPGAELSMIAGISQAVDPSKPGEAVHTTLTLAAPLAYTYKRDSVHLYGNVVRATQGASRDDSIGSGDASQANQAFTLFATPLTWLAADTPLGAQNTLEVRVDGVRWHEVDSLAGQAPNATVYITAAGPDGKTVVSFGDGVYGARLPTGQENVRARYRAGMGRSGNVAANTITTPVTRPLGVTGVNNPLPALGGADPDGASQMRRQIPLAVSALDRLVGLSDYEDFTRGRAGIGRASAAQLFDGAHQIVHVTVAGAGDIPLADDADIITTLRSSLATFGDPQLPIVVAVRELVLLVITANLKIAADYDFQLVEPAVRAALLDGLGFDNRELGAPAHLSQVIALIQAVPGVDYVDVDAFAGVPESLTPAGISDLAASLTTPQTVVPAQLARFDTTVYRVAHAAESLTLIAAKNGTSVAELLRLNPGLDDTAPLPVGSKVVVFRGIRPAQLIMLSPAVPEALILKEVS
jgi:predicted phage baseplate assembly protein